MDLNTITTDDFKAQFPRDFPYLPVWVAGTYNQGEEVYYATTRLFYTANKNGVTSIPTTSADWDITTDSINNYVQDSDITRAFAEAQVTFNQGLFSSDPNTKMGYLYATAHYLVNDINAARNAFSSNGAFPLTSRSVGSVSESYAIPDRYLKDPILSFYTRSSYGLKYLNLILPKLTGNVQSVYGSTNA